MNDTELEKMAKEITDDIAKGHISTLTAKNCIVAALQSVRDQSALEAKVLVEALKRFDGASKRVNGDSHFRVRGYCANLTCGKVWPCEWGQAEQALAAYQQISKGG